MSSDGPRSDTNSNLRKTASFRDEEDDSPLVEDIEVDNEKEIESPDKISVCCAQGFTGKTILKPSILFSSSSAESSSSFVNSNASKRTFSLYPSRLSDAFEKYAKVDLSGASNSQKDETLSPNLDPMTPNMDEKNNCYPLITSTSVGSDFVFGQNIHERIEAKTKIPDKVIVTNGLSSAEMLFFSNVKKEAETKSENEENGIFVKDEGNTSNKKSLSEAAKEYEEARACKRKYDEVAVTTGEEDEINIVQINNCKLFSFENSSSNWVEKGRGILRLNDKDVQDSYSSRLIMRIAGSFRVILNTMIWSGMNAEKASKKSVRFTAINNEGQVKIYLVMANQKEIDQLYNALRSRVHKKSKISDIND